MRMKRFSLLLVITAVIAVIAVIYFAYIEYNKTPNLSTDSQAYRAITGPDLIIKAGFIYDIRAYGAVANDMTDDAAAVQAAINSAYADGGGTVYFPPGTWYISAVIKTWDDTDVSINIEGAGKKATLIKKYGVTNTPIFSFSSAPTKLLIYSNFSNFSLEGNAQGNDGLKFYNCARFRVDNVFISDCNYGIYSQGSLVYSVVRSTLQDNTIGIYVTQANDVFANHIVLQDCEIISNDQFGVDFSSGSNFKLLGCDIEFNGAAGDTASGGVIIENNIDYEIGFATVTVNNCLFESNYGIAFQTEPSESIHDVLLTIEDTTFLNSEDGNAVVISDIEKLLFLNSHAPSAFGDTVDVYDTTRTFFLNSRIICLNDYANYKVHYNLD